MQATAIIVAAGRGTRAGGPVAKQYQLLNGEAVLRHTVRRFLRHPEISQTVLVIHKDDHDLCKQALGDLHSAVSIVNGGATRAISVQNGLKAVSESDPVLIHDAARPLVSNEVITRVLEALKHSVGAAPALGVVDALWKGAGGKVVTSVPRDGLFRAQTPQGFHRRAILNAHAAADQNAADDVQVALAQGIDVAIVEGDERNLKITRPEDFARAEEILRQEAGLDIRCGNGFDVHSFVEGDHVILCGVRIPFDQGLNGHSDSDVGMHALTDAIYGALGLGDIGKHFPPSDDQWKGADSRIFLKHAVASANERGFTLTNCDVTLICEQPKIGPHVQPMRQALAETMNIDLDRVSVKATTSEKLGFTGRGEGIASIATATLVKS
ncbi:bifunctional 2-C-methyl-D-erythritol 4-phosphate cytidylyltransferase/2-C-methyl-D-erythritol 2,4-cyclodiphosphate synthase [Actibacterium pelagium]|uniref:Bifunctional enzyme IspD/IspF n=1 Tax=Actibacterium pelagium TaxID=2029103 RepID=A0A917AD84_9RHOB|nr:bifunctional 2-C-methyl-D-erythritol 4-phosphate cytidylyltransferase/2-C-methyl-D-erythritol 2,4-cyclodiphosphate synthase [Actibacterium pelagium]GGE42940.1 bifunctional enzyme IspD/IspF [Actibacterium pelagium]